VLLGVWGVQYDMAVEAQKRGLKKLFHPESIALPGGGNKGRVFPEGYRDFIAEMFGVRAPLRPNYGMSEVLSVTRLCPGGHYHLYPYLVPYVLDPKTGVPAPRNGVQTGRFGLFDLNPFTHWGGFLTGDEVTLSWGDTAPCACGRQGPYLHENIRRYSDKEGGDDKTTCAGTSEAHDKALEFLFELI
jgi:hypothetical protein